MDFNNPSDSAAWRFLVEVLTFFFSLPRFDALWGGRLSIAVLSAAVIRAVGEAAGESSWTQGGSQESWEVEEDLLPAAAGPPAAAALAGAQQGPGQAVRHYTRCGRDAASWLGPVFDPLYWRACPSRGAPLWEESFPLQQLKKPDPERPPDRGRQLAGGQSWSGRRPGRGFVLPPQAVHPTAASPLADGQLRPRSGQRPVAQSEGDAQQGGATLPAPRPEEDQPHHRSQLRTQVVREDVCQHAAGRDVF